VKLLIHRSSPHSAHLFYVSFFPAHLLQPLHAQKLLDRPLVFVVFALQATQLLTLRLQLLLDLPALLIHALTLDTQQIELATDHGLPAQQRQQLPMIQHAVVRPVTGQQSLQRRLLPLETGPFPKQRLQLLLGTQQRLFAALPTELTERQQAPPISQ
jgi:hypothetical protein